ncbi:P-loop NTPase fold protein [Brasilonema bromeliae]|uniref:KAP NTPase domain-containing protein n=1 Tax=Brasilonema bromeliae SPC951 TaxID=385972 RepID=A0ABX1PDI2_9CYAN|nr:P-loop NTPase fold protein [Brasilonema bromeliae]NMG22543.1 hypothetical protein [Brasilonema bromeliae SPC951]
MNLSDQQRKKLQDALISAFPSRESLEMMLRAQGVDIGNLQILSNSNYSELVFQLIEHQERIGRLETFVHGVRRLNPGNPKLRAIAQELLTPGSVPNTSFAENTKQPDSSQDSIQNYIYNKGASNDLVGDRDQLGFDCYVKAFADIIESPNTKPPLTIGIFGSWGTGKSFLLDHITTELEQRSQQRKQEKQSQPKKSTNEEQKDSPYPHVHVIKLNAWEYSAAKAIWPGLVRKIMNQLEKELAWGFPGLFWKKFLLNLKREYEDNKSKIILFFAILLGFLVLNLFKLKLDLRLIWGALLALGVTGTFKLVADTISKPLSQWMETVLKGTDYGKQINYMEEIYSDLELLAQRLKNNNGRVLIIIDDLDRCEPLKAVEVLQAINLLLNFKSFIVCLGIDARIITRAIEQFYKNMLGPAKASGYEYLDKIIQIPFRIPESTPDEIELFLSDLLGDSSPSTSTASSSSERTTQATSNSNVQNQGAPVQKNTPVEPPALITFNDKERVAFKRYTRFLQANPRHLKRLVNVYRLVRTLAEYKQEDFITDNPDATICWLVICSQWPYTAYAMLYYFQELLERWEEEKENLKPRIYDEEKVSESSLEYLYQEVLKQLEQSQDAKNKQRKLDHDPDLLRMLLKKGEPLTWEQLYIVNRYTVNFNPAVESTIKSEVPVKVSTDDLSNMPDGFYAFLDILSKRKQPTDTHQT